MILVSQKAMLARPPLTSRLLPGTAAGGQRSTRRLFIRPHLWLFSSSISKLSAFNSVAVPSLHFSLAASYRPMSNSPYHTAMGEGVVKKRGRGFNVQSNYPSGPEDGPRLDRPIFLDEEPDREDIVMAARPKRALHGTPIASSPPETNGGVKVSTPGSPASQNQVPEEPKPRKVKPALEVFKPRFRRESLGPEQQQAIDKPARNRLDNSGLDFSRVTKGSHHVQTLQQALTPNLVGDGKSMPPVSGLRLEGTSHPSTGAKAPRATPVSTKDLTEALKSLPPRASPNGGFRSSAIQRGPVSQKDPAIQRGPATPISVAEVVTEEALVQHERIVDHSFETSAVVAEEIPHYEPATSHSFESSAVVAEENSQLHEPTTDNSSDTSAVDSGVTTDIQVEESWASTDNMASTTEEFESYQLGADERFASESSDESESVTSTIHEYDEVSENEAASGDEIVRKKVRKPKPVETSDGLVYYQVAVDEKPYVPLTYEIPLKDLTRLLCLKDDSKSKYWTYDLYQHEEKKISVECCTTLQEFETAAQKFLGEKVIGFDLEWLPRPSKRVWDNVSLIQLAKEDHIALFHLGRMKKEKVEELIPSSLKTILESKDILKVGVSVAGDGSRIKKWLGIEPQGLMELSAIHHVLEYARERRRGQIPRVLVSLAKLSEKYLQLPIHKGFVRISDWTKPLTPMQISYAATDAYAGLRIFDALQKARMLIDPIPMLPACVKSGDDKKKRGVVTPKLYIDGVEAGANSASTWNTNFETTIGTARTSVVMDWAQEVEENRMRYEAAAVVKTKGPGKKSTNTNTANIHGQPSSNRRSSGKKPVKPALSLSPEQEFATEWAKKHLAERTGSGTTAAPLRAYALWHWKGYTLEETARHLEISVKTAASYICQATRIDHLEHDSERMKYVWSMNTPRWGRRL